MTPLDRLYRAHERQIEEVRRRRTEGRDAFTGDDRTKIDEEFLILEAEAEILWALVLGKIKGTAK